MERGLEEHYFLRPSTWKVQSTSEVRYYTARELQRHGSWEIGITLGVFAQTFGAKALLDWISHWAFHDYNQARILNDDVVRLNYAYEHTDYARWHTEIVDF